jgi:hypothetical protein
VGLRLVEEKHVGTTRKARGENCQLAMPAAQVLHRPLDLITETEGPKITASLALEAGSAQFREAAQEALLAHEHTLHPAQVRCHLWRAKLLPARVQEHRGLARTVGCDQPDPRPRVHLEVQAPQHGPSPVKLRHGPQPDEGHATLPSPTLLISRHAHDEAPVVLAHHPFA